MFRIKAIASTGLAAALMLSSIAALAQTKAYKPPRTLDGKPSLEGTWTNATLTALQRPSKFKELVIPAKDIEKETSSHPQVVRQLTDDKQDETTKLTGGDLNSGRGYNAFWIDPGMTYNQVNGEYRTSFIVDPPSGQIPFKPGMARMRRGGGEGDSGAERPGAFDGPEARPLGERCFLTSGSAGPPMMTYLYNNNYEFFQTKDSFAIRVEMNNYARVVRIGGTHLPASIRPIHGDSIGHWDGDTLVVETTNFSPYHSGGMIGLTDTGKVTERFTRVSATQVNYKFTVEDPARYSQPWSGEYSFNTAEGHVYEYACHEGNYALSGILSGAREAEKRDATKK
ncbi:MAG TPA: hypothetical protein VK629_20155 [Steroidobacteraceae bacterium]|nr:hypothetical protein [Steroidobacteraceae bacterium]